MKKLKKNNLFLLPALALLCACEAGEVQQTLGINKKAPDEFRVISRPPLSLPPDFNLRPPMSADEYRATQAASKKARKAVVGESFQLDGARSAGESNFLGKIGAAQADPEIKSVIKSESVTTNESILESLTPKKQDPIVRPDKEKERIDENIDAGKTAAEGDTETFQPKSKTVLDDLIN